MIVTNPYAMWTSLLLCAFLGNSVSMAEDKVASTLPSIFLSDVQWRAEIERVSSEQRPRRLRYLDGPASQAAPADDSSAYRIKKMGTSVAFEVGGRLSERRTMIWSAAVNTSRKPGTCRYYSFRYRARGIERSHPPTTVLAATGTDGEGKAVATPLVTADQILNDDCWHFLVGKKEITFPIDGLQVQVTTTDSSGRFELEGLAFHESLPEFEGPLPGWKSLPLEPGVRLQGVDLGHLPNDSYRASFQRILDTYGMAVDGGAWPGGCFGIPFDGSEHTANLIRPADWGSANAERVDLLGTKTTRRYYKPQGRDDLITIPVGKHASEVFFIMAAEMPPRESCYVRPAWPRPVDDIESLAVELQYADGDRDFAFPYSLADHGFMVRRALSAYAVPADPERELARFILHNRQPGKTFSLGAVTVNTSPDRAVPEMSIDGPPVHVPDLPKPSKRPATVRRDGDQLTLSNTCFDLVVDCSHGFSIASVRQRYSETQLPLSPSSGLEIELADTILTGRAFKTESIQVEENTARIRLTSLVPEMPLRLAMQIAIDDSPQVTMNLAVENAGQQPLEPTIRFPVLRDLKIGDCADTWLFFPQYRNVITNQCGAYLTPNDHCFPMQVCDIYNPKSGLGLALLTHNLDHRSLDYAVAKTERGVSAFVQSPGEFCRIEPGKAMAQTEACMVVHPGDWHGALRVYRGWLAEVTKSSKAQDEDWFRQTFLLRTHQAKKFYDWAVSIFDPDKNSYRIDDFVKVDTEYLGMRPQVFHLFGWTDLENGWHGHPNGDYLPESITGGLEALKAAVDRLQNELGIAASLYTISDRCFAQSEFGRAHGRKCAICRKDGTLVENDENCFLCGNTQAWRNQYVESLCRVQRETGVKMLYVDVFPFFRSSTCYSPDHGHEVPSHVNRGTYALIRQLRERLPDGVVLWSEYPLPDMSQSWIDGNIHYYCLDWHTHFGKLYDKLETAPSAADVPHNLYRFVFPNLKQFIFPCGVSPNTGDTKFPFFNGEALYDCGWSLYCGPNLDRIKKSLALQREYADCFASPEPTAEVETLEREVHANCFPGEGRTVWTLYNARYTTFRGPVLAIEHRPGATYRDAWNDVRLEPEIVDGKAVLRLRLDPQQLGCVVQEWKQEQRR